jgi:DNA-binding NtrC family response regulator
VIDFPQIAGVMGLTPRERRQISGAAMAPAVAGSKQAQGAQVQASSPYALFGVDSAGHMRKLEEIEAEVIRMAIARYDGRMSEVARRLAIGRSTLYRKLKELGLEQGTDAPPGGDPPEDAPRAVNE